MKTPLGFTMFWLKKAFDQRVFFSLHGLCPKGLLLCPFPKDFRSLTKGSKAFLSDANGSKETTKEIEGLENENGTRRREEE